MSLTKQLLDIMIMQGGRSGVRKIKDLCFAEERKRIWDEVRKLEDRYGKGEGVVWLSDLRKLLEVK